MKHILHSSVKAFSIIEVLIGIFVFTLGLLSTYMLLMSSLNINEYNKNAIIASQLSREQIEIFRNIRDTNYIYLKVWNQQNPQVSYDTSSVFLTGAFYTLENDFSASVGFSAKVKNISVGFEEGTEKVSGNSMKSYQLCLTPDGRYVYCQDFSGDAKEVPFFRYLSLENIKDQDGVIIQDAFRVTSKVIWNIKGYHEYDIKTVVTDWRRI